MSLPYGSWPSPFAAADVALSAPRIDGARFSSGAAGDEEIWWGESVPNEGGRMTVRSSTGAEILPAPWSARSRVHEYGGGSWTSDGRGTLFFVESGDQRVYRRRPGGSPEPLTAHGPSYGGLRWQCGRLLAVREDLRSEPHLRAIVEIPTESADIPPRVHAEGPGFFAHPALSPDGTRVAWVQWSEERMPWEGAELAVSGAVIAGIRTALQPEWTDDRTLLVLDDPTGRWNIHRVGTDGTPTPVAPADADTGGGLWVLGNRWYRPLADGRILAIRTNGSDELVLIGADGTAESVPFPADGELSIEDGAGPRILVSGQGGTVSRGLWVLDLEAGTTTSVRGGDPVDPLWMPPPRAVTVDGRHGPVHAFDYPPTHPGLSAPGEERPPYIVFVHGGPTSHVPGSASSAIAFYTSRGIGVLDVNYGGSTGYGRDYRERLDGQWGVVDVDDVLDAARGLADSGAADPRRIAIRGGSAGGWTVLCALVRGGVFGAGISRYGVSDLRRLAEDTHDFEKHYLTGLVGPLPEAEQVYIERSPLSHAERIDVPVLLLQGSADLVVPPSQSAAIRDALAARGIPHEYVLYDGEGHGFRKAETIVDALERELRFLGSVFGFAPRL